MDGNPAGKWSRLAANPEGLKRPRLRARDCRIRRPGGRYR
jgi:hypothetical protein